MKIFGQHDQNTIDQFNKCMQHPAVYDGILSADGHLGYGFPVGGVIAFHDHISLNGVGVDIGCGNKAVKLDMKVSDVKDKQWAKIADEIAKNISFGMGRTNNVRLDHDLFDDDVWKMEPLRGGTKQKAREQLGTCGSGNHFCDILVDDQGHLWISVHFGSRGLGHTVAMHFIQVAGGSDGMNADQTVVSTKSNLGQDYIAAMQLAGRYAYAGRDYVVDTIAKNILGAKIIDEIHNHHNFAWLEKHGGHDVWVVRKGATPAFPDQRGFVGGSMGDVSVILRGKDCKDAEDSLYSTVHGAGRVMSRSQAAGKVKWIKDEITGKKIPHRIKDGLVNETSMRQRIANAGIELRGSGADEAPEVYRKLDDVLNAHADTIKIEYRLTPKVVVMAGADIVDPYKD